MCGRPSWMSRSGREARPDVREWSKGPLVYSVVVGRPFRMSGNGRESLSYVREWSGVLPMSGSGRETLLDVREVLPDF